MARTTAITKNNPRDLRLVTAGQGISLIGDSITQLALPIMAVDLLDADSLGTGFLGAASTLAYLFIGLQAGVWVDRSSRRAYLLAADLVRVVLLLAIPLAYVLGVLSLPFLIAMQVGLGAATVFFNVAWPAYIPRLASGPTLLKLNARMAIMGEGAGFVGPGLAGALINIFSAPFVLVVDAITFAVSYVSLRAIRTPEPPSPKKRNTLMHDLLEGLRELWIRPNLRLITLEAVNGNIAFSVMIGQAIIFQRIDLGFEPALIGAVASAGFLGGLFGSLSAPYLVKRVGFGRLMIVGTALFGINEFLLPAAAFVPREFAPLFSIANFFIGGYFLLIYVVPVTTFRQQAVPDRLLGRVMSINRTLTWGFGATFGYVVGGLLGNAFGRPTALIVGAILQTLVPLVIFGFARIWRYPTIESAAKFDNRAAAAAER
ncbi:MAG: MFS transporter [Chloroflexi bacterium]|jgi:MFS family permease|nr:MAG: MFS transporter [Chloroflexota bacterium]